MTDLDKKYQKKSERERVLLRPDTYIGSNENIIGESWLFNDTKMEKKTIEYNPGLLKIFDEILTNASDHIVRYPGEVTKIEVSVDQKENKISVYNNGPGIDIQIHSEHKCYYPELIFANLGSGTNYDDTEERLGGGRNGLGAKLAAIFSTKFEVETISKNQIYTQIYNDNLSKINKPVIKKSKKKDGTRITFYPDLKRFGLKEIPDNMVKLFYKRSMDIAACTDKSVNVVFNGKKINVKNFEHYVDLFCSKQESKRVIITRERWKVIFVLNPYDSFTQVSYVNCIDTKNGGNHVEHVIKPVIKKVIDNLSSKHKDVDIKYNYVKDNIMVFINSLIVNPGFKSQTKEELTTSVNKFGSRCDVTDAEIKQIVKLGIDKNVLAIAQAKSKKALASTDGKKKQKLTGIPKLDDANKAGSREAHKCTLILTEGDSAKTFAVAGLSKIGKDYYGVFPLKGKLLNVRKASNYQISKNDEITNLKLILGLKQGKNYNSVKELRYGKVMILTDQDSVTGDTPVLLKINNQIVIKNIEDLTTKFQSRIEKDCIFEKEYGLCNYEVWTETGWTKIKHVMRHKTKKKMYRVLTHTGCVDVTEDHSLLNEYGKKITPNECKVGDKLLHSFPKFEENKIQIPDNLENLNFEELRKLCSKIGVYSFMKMNKNEMIEKINDYKNSTFEKLNHTEFNYYTENEIKSLIEKHKQIKEKALKIIPENLEKMSNPEIRKIALKLQLNIQNVKKIIKKDLINKIYEYKSVLENKKLDIKKISLIEKDSLFKYHNTKLNITPEEAWVMGFFCADGCASIGKDKQKSLKWTISNCNLELLEKSKNILTKIYGDEFRIYKESKKQVENSYGVNDKYKLDLLAVRKKNRHIFDKYKKLFYYKEHKYIHQCILNGKKEIRKQFYNGYYEGDGNYGNRKATTKIDVNGKILSQCLCFLIKSLNYKVSLNHHTRKDKVYELLIGKSYWRDPIKIKKIIPLGVKDDYVYDLETENHHFGAGIGELTISNTDGFHIKGLLINFFQHFWPSLVKENDFITCLQTPIVKCTKGDKIVSFFNIPEYNTWKEKNNTKSWKIKYYKGLGTSNSKEAKECFKDLTQKQTLYLVKDTEDEEAIDLAFNIKRADNRKTWIKNATGKTLFLNNKLRKVPVKQFFNEEFVLFSIADNVRSIPHIMDGFKPSQRKVIYGCFKKNIKEEIKVDQLRGFISEKSAYHHGDMSLNETIISMAQNFIGSNNINLLEPCGMFGSRRLLGKDSASPRYIFTKLNELTRKIFLQEDDNLLNYLEDDGYPIEPEFYWPIIPMLLVNGSTGIGTGYSTDIPCYNPLEIINILLNLIKDSDCEIPKLVPWYNKFKGKIQQKENSENFISYGVCKRISRFQLKITELPIGLSNEKFKEKLDKLEEQDIIEDTQDNSSDVKVDFVITLSALTIDKWIKEDKVYSELGLTTTIKASNMKVFDCQNKLVSVNGPEEILYRFYRQRKKLYKKRYNYLLKYYKDKIKDTNSRLMFVLYIIEDKIKVFRVSKQNIKQQLEDLNFPTKENTYDYLLSMKIYSFTEEKMKELEKELNDYKCFLSELESKVYTDLWKEDLLILKQKLTREY